MSQLPQGLCLCTRGKQDTQRNTSTQGTVRIAFSFTDWGRRLRRENQVVVFLAQPLGAVAPQHPPKVPPASGLSAPGAELIFLTCFLPASPGPENVLRFPRGCTHLSLTRARAWPSTPAWLSSLICTRAGERL